MNVFGQPTNFDRNNPNFLNGIITIGNNSDTDSQYLKRMSFDMDPEVYNLNRMF